VLLANAPNPFSSSTTITFAVPAGTPKNVSVGVYDVSGRNVRVLQNGALAPGVHTCAWDGRDSEGRAVSAGVYLYRYQIASEVLTRKMVLMR
jgi:flagellar hook assembly protein FlgD